ncbi:unnamed protein product, partial [Scytosiphon promiscuus]
GVDKAADDTAPTSNMASLMYLIAIAVALCGLSRASACSCMPPGTLCDTIQDSDVVVRVKALSSVEGADINDDVVYTLETLEVFKAEEPGPNEYDDVGASFEMTTGGNSALCGVYMLMDGSTEYVLDMNRNNGGELYAAGICSLFQEWDEADRAEFEAGCDDYDPCNGTCSESQECLRSSGFYSEIEYYCSDTCDPNPCPEGTACTLDYPPCDGDFCVAEAVCGGGTMSPSTSPPIFTQPPAAVPDVAPDSPEGGDDDGTDETTPPSPAPQSGVTFAPTARGDDDFNALTLNPAPAGSPTSSSSPSRAPSEDGSRGTGLE